MEAFGNGDMGCVIDMRIGRNGCLKGEEDLRNWGVGRLNISKLSSVTCNIKLNDYVTLKGSNVDPHSRLR